MHGDVIKNRAQYLFVPVLLFISSLLPAAHAQNARNFTGKEFWFALIENNINPVKPFDSFDVVITCQRKDTITLSTYNFGPVISNTYYVWPNKYNRIKVAADWVYYKFYSQPVLSPVDIGVQIKSKFEVGVQVYNLVSGSNSGTSILPKSLLENGQEYILHGWPGRGTSQAAQAVIVAMDTGRTFLEITPSNSLYTGQAQGVTLYDTLKQGQSFMIMAFDTFDLSGTRILVTNSCKKVAVFSGARCARVLNANPCSSCDAVFEQVFPKSYAAKSFIAGPMVVDTIYQISVVPVANNTNVKINGVTVGNYSPYNPYKKQIKSSKPVWIETDKPAQVMLINNSAGCNGAQASKGDPSLTYISPVGQGIKNAYFATQTNPKATDHYLLVYTRRQSMPGNIKLNGSAFVPISGWKSSIFSGQTIWYAYTTLLSGSNYTLTSSDTGFWAYLYGYGDNESYGVCLAANLNNYFADFSMSKEQVCGLNQGVNFTANGDSVNQISWNFGDGGSANGTNVSHIYTKAGRYQVKMINSRAGNFCGADTVKKVIEVFAQPAITLDKDTHPCLGNPLRLELANNARYNFKWEDNTSGNIHLVFADKTVVLTTTDTNGCVKTDSMVVKFKDCNKTNLQISNIFTPNGDGFNDQWRVIYEGYDLINIRIINRYGAVVASYSLPDQSDWNGKVNNNQADCPEGTYYYYLEALQNRTKLKRSFKGAIYLAR